MGDLPPLKDIGELAAFVLVVFLFVRYLTARSAAEIQRDEARGKAMEAHEKSRDALLAEQADARDRRFAELVAKTTGVVAETTAALVQTVAALADLKTLMDELRSARRRKR